MFSRSLVPADRHDRVVQGTSWQSAARLSAWSGVCNWIHEHVDYVSGASSLALSQLVGAVYGRGWYYYVTSPALS